jgi:hypothetical protein
MERGLCSAPGVRANGMTWCGPATRLWRRDNRILEMVRRGEEKAYWKWQSPVDERRSIQWILRPAASPSSAPPAPLYFPHPEISRSV